MLPKPANPVTNTEIAHESRVIRVAARSRSTSVAGAIAHTMRERGYAEVQAIGAGAVNQALKAVTIARSYLEGDGIAIMFTPQFAEVDIEGEKRSAIKFVVEKRVHG